MYKVIILTSLITAIISTGIIIGAGYALKHVLEPGDVITGASIGLSSGVGIFFLFRSRYFKKCGK